MDRHLTPELEKGKSSSQSSSRSYDVVALPSKGKLYPNKLSEVEIYYMTAQEEDILTSPNIIKSGKIFTHLLKSALRDKSIDPESLLIGDRNMLLVWLRSTGYGPEYSVGGLKCSSCGKMYEHEFDLSSLRIQELELDPNENGLFSFTLPLSKKVVWFKLLTGGDEQNLNTLLEAQESKKGHSNAITNRLLAYIQHVEGVADENLKDFIVNLRTRDNKAFRDYVEKIQPQVKMEQDVTCPHCSFVNEGVHIPITERFFWPEL